MHVTLQTAGIDPLLWEIRSLPIVTSTNDYLGYLLELNATHAIVLSTTQENGRGRGDNAWASPIGGIWVSFGLKGNFKVVELSTPIINTIKNIIAKYVECEVKDPNDILVRGKKICGVLVETKILGDRIKEIIVGIGINVRNDIPSDLLGIATTLKDHVETPPTVVSLAVEVVKECIITVNRNLE